LRNLAEPVNGKVVLFSRTDTAFGPKQPLDFVTQCIHRDAGARLDHKQYVRVFIFDIVEPSGRHEGQNNAPVEVETGHIAAGLFKDTDNLEFVASHTHKLAYLVAGAGEQSLGNLMPQHDAPASTVQLRTVEVPTLCQFEILHLFKMSGTEGGGYIWCFEPMPGEAQPP